MPAPLSAPAPSADLPLSGAEFGAALDRLGPFEADPHIAVAVSGGRDSLALTLLAAEWTKSRAGKLTALIVDHGLRVESSEEAGNVAGQLRDLGIEVEILSWQGDKPATGVAEAARVERYRLLHDWCAQRGVLHLLLAHQRDDQAETVLLRLGDGSGPDGLAGMASVRETAQVRLLRPLLHVPRARLTATLVSRGVPWVDDPTNSNLRYLRPRLRHAARADVNQAGIAAAQRFATDRAALERRMAALLCDAVSLHAEGWLAIDREFLRQLPNRLATRLLAQAIHVIGGASYAPRRQALDNALRALAAGQSTTAGGCRLVLRREGIVVAREWGAIEQVVTVQGATRLRWDNRFELELDGSCSGLIAALGEPGRDAVMRPGHFAGPVRERIASLPSLVALSLPGLWNADKTGKPRELLAVGDGGRPGLGPATLSDLQSARFFAVFRPGRPLAGPPHALVLAG